MGTQLARKEITEPSKEKRVQTGCKGEGKKEKVKSTHVAGVEQIKQSVNMHPPVVARRGSGMGNNSL